MDNLHTLPVWKKDASLSDRLFEMAVYARANPELFDKFVMVYNECLSSGNWKVRTFVHNCSAIETFGLLEVGKSDVMDQCLK